MKSRLDAAAPAALFLATAVFAAVCIAALWRVAATIGLHVPLDLNEGWNAYHTDAVMSGRALYPPPQSNFANNYPPLSFYVVGALSRITGDAIFAGRLISLFAFLLVAAGIWCALRLMGCGRHAAGFAALFFAATLLVGSEYVGMDDPQLLGHALEMGALLLALRGRDWLSAFVFVVAIFVKHNLVAMPVALALWLFVEDRRRALRFVASGAAFSLLGLGVFRLVYGSSLLSHLVSARSYSLVRLEGSAGRWIAWSVVPLAVLGSLAAHYRRDKFVMFVLIYAAVAVALGVAFCGGAGVDANVFFEADIALALGVGLAMSRLASRSTLWPAGIAVALLVPLAVSYIENPDADWTDPDFWIHPMADDDNTTRNDVVFLAAHSGRAFCETLSLCYWAGKPREVDAFNLGQEFATGARRDSEFVRSIERHDYATMEFDTMTPFRFTPHVRAALYASYRIDHVDDDGLFFVPRNGRRP